MFMEELTITTPTPRIEPFTRLRSNVKVPSDITLGPCTALMGGNRTGKTSILDTIRLALTGKHPIGPHACDLQELMPAGAAAIDAILSGPSGAAHWRLEAPEGKARKPAPPNMTGALDAMLESERACMLSLDGIGELIRFGNNRMREALMTRFGTATDIPTPIGLNTAQLELWAKGKNETAQHTEPSKQLAAMAKWFRSKSRKYNDDATSLSEAIARRQAQMSEHDAGSELLPQYQARLAQAQAWEHASALRARKAELEAQLANLRQLAQATIEQHDAWVPGPEPQALEPYETALDEAHQLTAAAEASTELARQLLELIQQMGDTHTCPICLTTDVDLRDRITRIQNLLGERQAEITRLAEDESRCAAVVGELQVEWAQYWESVSSNPYAAEKAQLRTTADKLLGELDGVNAGLVDVPDNYDGPPAHELKTEIERIKALEVTRTKLFADSEDMHRLRAQAETCKVLERESAKILKELLRNVQSTAETSVNKYMPAGFRAVLVITDKAVEWRVVGRDGVPHKRGGMCGSEFASLVVAVACAWTEGSPLRMVLLDDVDLGCLDHTSLVAVLSALGAAQRRGDITQLVIGWNRPNETLPDGWHIVRLGSTDAAAQN